MRLTLSYFATIAFSFLIAEDSSAQGSQCPYEYFSLRAGNRDYFSFQVKVQDNVRLACGTFAELEFYYKKYKPKYITYTRTDIANILSGRLVLKSPVPFDSLYFFDFASKKHIDQAVIIAQKGEKYFINYYFNKSGCIKKEFINYEPAIMKYLQTWCIAARQDDETGCLYITYKFSPLNR